MITDTQEALADSIDQTTPKEGQEIILDSVDKLIEYINLSSLPLRIHTDSHEIHISKDRIKNLKDIKLENYSIMQGQKRLPFFAVIEACVLKWPQHFKNV